MPKQQLTQNPGAQEFALGDNSQGLSLAGAFQLSRIWNGDGSRLWWLGTSNDGGASVTGGTGYADGYYPFTATGGGCAREPTGVWSSERNGRHWSQRCDCRSWLHVLHDTDNQYGIHPDRWRASSDRPSRVPDAACRDILRGCQCRRRKSGSGHGACHGRAWHHPRSDLYHAGLQRGSAPGFTGYNGTYTALLGTSGTTLVGTTGATNCPSTPPIHRATRERRSAGRAAQLHSPVRRRMKRGYRPTAANMCAWLSESLVPMVLSRARSF